MHKLHVYFLFLLFTIGLEKKIRAGESNVSLLANEITGSEASLYLHQAILDGCTVATLQSLLKNQRYSVALHDNNGLTALEVAAQQKKWPLYITLLHHENILIHYQAMYGTLKRDANFDDIIVLGTTDGGTRLFNMRNSIEKRNAHGLTPLMCAVLAGNIENIYALIDCGADVNAYNEILNCTALSLAAFMNYQAQAHEFEHVANNTAGWQLLISNLKKAEKEHILTTLLDAGAEKNPAPQIGKPLLTSLDPNLAEFIKTYQPQPITRVYQKNEEPCCHLWEWIKMCYSWTAKKEQ